MSFYRNLLIAILVVSIGTLLAGWILNNFSFADAQSAPPAPASATPATQALNTALQNAIQQTARAQDIQIDLLGIYKSIPPAILAYVQEQQQLAAEKDQWWARQNAGMQQLLDTARAQAKQ